MDMARFRRENAEVPGKHLQRYNQKRSLLDRAMYGIWPHAAFLEGINMERKEGISKTDEAAHKLPQPARDYGGGMTMTAKPYGSSPDSVRASHFCSSSAYLPLALMMRIPCVKRFAYFWPSG